MYKPDFRIIHIIKTLMNSIHTIDYNTKFNILTELNIYAIDSLKQKEIMENKINELEDDIKIIKINLIKDNKINNNYVKL